MKILFFTRSFYPHVGGVEKHIFEISQRLIQSDHQVTVITEENEGTILKNSKPLEKIQGVDIYRIPITADEKGKKYEIWKWLWQHRKLIRQSDVIHCHDVFYWYLPFRFLYPGKKVFTTFHGYESYPIKIKAVLYRKLFELLSNGSICVGEFMKRHYYANPSIITYGGVTLPMKDTKPQKHTAIFIGRLDNQTGIKSYVESARRIQKEIPSFKLVVFGDGPLREGSSGNGILWKGFNRTADKEIAKFEIAFISRYLAILEALAAKRLVIAVYDNPVKEDYLKMTPFSQFIEVVSNVDEITKTVKNYYIKESEYEKKISGGYEWVKTQTWEHLVNQYIELWNKRK